MGIRQFQGRTGGSQDGREDSGLDARFIERSKAPGAGFTVGLFVIALFGALHFARDFFMPLVLGLLLALILLPAVHALARRRIPTPAGAAIVLLSAIGLLALGGYFLAPPLSEWGRKGPQMVERISAKFHGLTEHFKVNLDSDKNRAPEQQQPRVNMNGPGILNFLAIRSGALIALAGTTFILVYFLLAAGDALFGGILGGISDPKRKEQTMAIGHEIKLHISKYLLATTGINLAEGALLAGGLALAGMPTPILWGSIHAFLNFIPYIGSITGLSIVAMVSLISFDSVPRAAIAPSIYLAIMILDNFASPLVLGKRLVLNSAVVFASLMFWGWMWGIAGVLVAIPILMTVKIICDHVPSLERYGNMISGSTGPTNDSKTNFSRKVERGEEQSWAAD